MCSHNAQTHGISGLCFDTAFVFNGEPNPSKSSWLAHRTCSRVVIGNYCQSRVYCLEEHYCSLTAQRERERERERAAVLLQLLLSELTHGIIQNYRVPGASSPASGFHLLTVN